MKKIPLQIAVMLFGFSPLFSQQNVWTQKATFFEAREGAASFTINNKLYVGTGNEKNDLWEYDPATNAWTRKADLPAAGRSYAVGFSIGNKGYIATGSTAKVFPGYTDEYLMSDVWEYDPVADSWNKKANFAGGIRSRAVAFVLNNKAYVGSGENVGSPGFMPSDFRNRVASDFWAFDPAANTWDSVANIPMRRMNAIAFSSNGKGFVGTGFYNTYSFFNFEKIFPGDNLQDLWAYDTATNTWAKKSDFPGGKRMGMSVFSMGDTIYSIAGAVVTDRRRNWTSDTDIIKKDVWAYNTVTDTWVQKPDFPDTARRRYSIAAAIAGKGYFGIGGVNDLWEYAPYSNVLPVTLVSFGGTIQNNTTKLEWKVENEQTLDHYEVYKSLNGTDFNKSGEVKAANKKQYNYEDNSPSITQILYYRLKIVDKDGSFIYSKTIMFTNNKDGLEITSFYPSPLTGNTGYLNITSAKSQKLQVMVTDITGHQISTQAINIIAGSNNIPLTFGKLAAGTYLLRVMDENNGSNTIRFVKN